MRRPSGRRGWFGGAWQAQLVRHRDVAQLCESRRGACECAVSRMGPSVAQRVCPKCSSVTRLGSVGGSVAYTAACVFVRPRFDISRSGFDISRSVNGRSALRSAYRPAAGPTATRYRRPPLVPPEPRAAPSTQSAPNNTAHAWNSPWRMWQTAEQMPPDCTAPPLVMAMVPSASRRVTVRRRGRRGAAARHDR